MGSPGVGAPVSVPISETTKFRISCSSRSTRFKEASCPFTPRGKLINRFARRYNVTRPAGIR